MAFFVLSCGEDKKERVILKEQEQQNNEDLVRPPSEPSTMETAAVETSLKPVIHEGRYQRISPQEPDPDCRCSCIEINLSRPTSWCIVRDKVYISARSEKISHDKVAVFYVASEKDVQQERSFPWESFDTDTPIAHITFLPDGSAELDWLGFHLDGKIATDFAIFGKKTLEGTYKKA